jgi:hypothetical protein
LREGDGLKSGEDCIEQSRKREKSLAAILGQFFSFQPASLSVLEWRLLYGIALFPGPGQVTRKTLLFGQIFRYFTDF